MLTTKTRPFLAARYNGVLPSTLFFKSRLAVAAINRETMEAWPSSAAKCNGVLRLMFVAFTFAPAAINVAAMVTWPVAPLEAKCSGVSPKKSA